MCLTLVIYGLVLILFEKNGNFLSFVKTFFSRIYKIESNTYITILTHISLHYDMKNDLVQFQMLG